MHLSDRNKLSRKQFADMWMKRSEMLEDEILQAQDEGRELPENVQAKALAIRQIEDPQRREQAALEFSRMLWELPYRPDYPYEEPSDYEGILCERPEESVLLPQPIAEKRFDQVYGALLGRCAGCLLGSPVEGWPREKILKFMKETKNDPIRYYFRSDISDELRAKYDIKDEAYRYGRPVNTWANLVKCMPEDDDTDYTLLNLLLLEEIGRNFTTEDCAYNWLYHMPMFHTAVSERIVYQNLTIGLPVIGGHLDPYRETLGPQLRADVFGYVNPGDVETAANMAWRDGRLTNVKNGIYGSMFAAAMLAAAAATNSVTDIVKAGISVIPKKSRLYECVNLVVKWHKDGNALQDTTDLIYETFNKTACSKTDYAMCHVNPNCMIVAASLLYGELDFEKSIGIAVMSGFDTDCNGATVGSIAGIALGANALPQKWVLPLNNRVETCITGYDDQVKLDEVAQRILAVY